MTADMFQPTDGDPELAAVIRQRLDEMKAERQVERQVRNARHIEHCLGLLREGEA